MAAVPSALTPARIIPAVTILLILWFFLIDWRAAWSPRSLGDPARSGPARLSFPHRCFPMTRRDALPVLLITAVYACTAFFQLGSRTAPQTYQSFEGGASVTIALSRPVSLSGLMYYPRLGTGSYRLEISADGSSWRSLIGWPDGDGKIGYSWGAPGADTGFALPQGYTTLFKWNELALDETVTVQFLRLTGQADRAVLQLGELALYGPSPEDGTTVRLPIVSDLPSAGADGLSADGAAALFDEGETVPARPDWYNSAYFDEIYHPRTALEHIEGIAPYEISHPPLGKLILGLGIRLFGMTPFGWRFMGTLLGAGMLPLLYVFLKNLFGRTAAAACGTALFAADFMHLTQTRLATIDTYAVFFILLMYYFLYRWLVLPPGHSFARGALPLFLSGISWGVGAACKWTVIYGGLGLAALYFIGLRFKYRDWPAGDPDSPQEPREAFGPWAAKTLGFSVLCFVILPAAIYTLSYLPYARAGGTPGLEGLFSAMWENQKYMLSYHRGVDAVHPYSSRWYQWVVDARPILYYLDWQSFPGKKEAFAAFVNPVVCWGGLLAVLTLLARAVSTAGRRLIGASAPGRMELDGRALFILVGYFSQLAPWFAIGRTTFAYHYFPSVLFLVLALSYILNELIACPRVRRGRAMAFGLTAGAAGLYALFYPVLIGLIVPDWYGTNLLKWFPSWPF